MSAVTGRRMLAGAAAAVLATPASATGNDARLLALLAELQRRESAEGSACADDEEAGSGNTHWQAAYARVVEITEAIADTPADGLLGVVVKALVLLPAADQHSTEHDVVIASLERDTARLGLPERRWS